MLLDLMRDLRSSAIRTLGIVTMLKHKSKIMKKCEKKDKINVGRVIYGWGI